jgi:hypothetical protein
MVNSFLVNIVSYFAYIIELLNFVIQMTPRKLLISSMKRFLMVVKYLSNFIRLHSMIQRSIKIMNEKTMGIKMINITTISEVAWLIKITGDQMVINIKKNTTKMR